MVRSLWRWAVASTWIEIQSAPASWKSGTKARRVLDHEVDVDGQARLAADGRDEPGPEGQVGHEMPVHDVDVDEVGPGRPRPVRTASPSRAKSADRMDGAMRTITG